MNEELKNRIVDKLPLVLFVTDSDFAVRYKNRQFEELFNCAGNTREVGKLIGCRTLLSGGVCTKEPDCLACQLRQSLIDAVKKGRQVYKRLVEKAVVVNGVPRTLHLKVTISPLGDGEYVCTMDDVTEILALSEEEKKLNKQLLSDLKKARHIQRDLLPRRGEGGLNFDYLYRQLSGVGGDFFDVYRIDDTHVGLYVADVSGHGLGGGMLTVFLKENFNRSVVSPAVALEELYHRFNRFRFSEEAYITAFSAVLDEAEGVLTYCNAGHNVPMFVERDGEVREFLDAGAPVSNWYKSAEYANGRCFCPRGSKILFATDGVTDRKDAGGAEFGTEPLKACLRAPSPQAAAEALSKAIDAFDGGNKDDVAVLIAEV